MFKREIFKSSKHSVDRSSRGSVPRVEGLEDRQLMSAVKPLASLGAASPKSILYGGVGGNDTVTIHNYTKLAVTEPVSITLQPSLDGVNASGSYSTPGVSETITIKKGGKFNVKVPFMPTTDQAGGTYYTLATVDVDGAIVTAKAPGKYTWIAPTTTPSLIGEYRGLIVSTKSESTGFFGGGTSTQTRAVTFIWETTAQDQSSLTGLFAVGEQQEEGVMQGYELSNGVVHYTFSSDLINYTMDGKVSANGTKITGKWKGTLVNNLFTNLGGSFKITETTV